MSDKQRAAFEVMESKRKGFASDTLTRATFEPDDEYLLPLVQARWEGYQAALASPEAQALRAALTELIECKNIKERIAILQVQAHDQESVYEELSRLMREYGRKQPAAWEAARKAMEIQK